MKKLSKVITAMMVTVMVIAAMARCGLVKKEIVGTWKKEDDKYVLTSKGSDQEVVVAEDNLIIDEGALKVTFEKK